MGINEIEMTEMVLECKKMTQVLKSAVKCFQEDFNISLWRLKELSILLYKGIKLTS